MIYRSDLGSDELDRLYPLPTCYQLEEILKVS